MLLVISFSIGNKVHSSCGALHGLPKDDYQGTPVLHIGESRTTYDSCYRMKAANIKSLEWGWAKAFLCCVHRSSELHSSTTWPDVPTSADMQMEGPPRKTRRIMEHSGSVCGLFNNRQWNQCTYTPTASFLTCVQSGQVTTHKATAPIQM